MKDFVATISEKSSRYQEWLEVLGSNKVILKSPLPHRALLPHGNAMVFDMDLEALTSEQRGRLIAHLSRKFDVPLAEVERDLDTIGCPILASEITITIFHPQKWT